METEMENRKPLPSPIGVGVITLITVLLVLCLTIFSILTYSSAKADLQLSQVNADAVSAYYAADSQAAELYAEFAAGTDAELDTTLSVSDTQNLHLHLVRNADGTVSILAWNTSAVSDSTEITFEDDFLPVWLGD